MVDAVEYAEKVGNFSRSMKNHQMSSQGISGFCLPVTLMSSDNIYLTYPVNGVIEVNEQGALLGISQATFHCLTADNALGAPCRVVNPRFEYRGD